MDRNTALFILTIYQVNMIVNCKFHEHSLIHINPQTASNQSGFGFSMAYQKSTQELIVGAPTEDNQGKVYTCELRNLTYDTQLYCSENKIILDPDEYSRKANPDQYFYMGASLAAAPNYFFTCAPLVTNEILNDFDVPLNEVLGTCFVYNGTANRYNGIPERYIKETKATHRTISGSAFVVGGIGWSTLIDETNELLILAKSSLDGDFVYTKMSEPLAEMITTNKWTYNFLKPYRNVGFAVTAGNFFSSETVYAASMTTQNMTGVIMFLKYDSAKHNLTILREPGNDPVLIEDITVGSMFGAALAAADLNRDGLAELLVGAPAYSDEGAVECGAVYIYLGCDLESIRSKRTKFMIVGSNEGARFGSVINTQDIDGDSFPEIIVSAYNEDGFGSVYVLSGYEVYNTLIRLKTNKNIAITELKSTQRIRQNDIRGLGFSLQFVSDVDDNGCNELAAGSPQNASVLLFKCIRSVNVTMSARQIGEATLKNKTLTVEVCAQVVYPNKPKSVFGVLNVSNNVFGEGAYIPHPNFSIDISCESCSRELRCRNITIEIKTEEAADYNFTTQAQMKLSDILSSTDFDGTAVMTSPYSSLSHSIDIYRHCEDDDCHPRFSLEFLWDGRIPYLVGSSDYENLTVLVKNEGNSSYDSCVSLRVSGALVAQVALCAGDDGNYKCDLPKPMRRHMEYRIVVTLDMTKPTNKDEELEVEGAVIENCYEAHALQDSVNNDTSYVYEFKTDDVNITGMAHDRQVADIEILNNDTIYIVEEYSISNCGSVTWKDVFAVITIEKKSFIAQYNIPMSKCSRKDSAVSVMFQCTMDLLRNTSQNIMVTQTINATESKLKEDKLNISSQFKLFLSPTSAQKQARVTSTITFQKDFTFANNKNLIILISVIVGLILLAVTAFIMYKCGFFKRKQKKRLEVLRESVRRRSSRRTIRDEHGGSMEDGLPNMNIGDDSPFTEEELVTQDSPLEMIQEENVNLDGHDRPQHSEDVDGACRNTTPDVIKDANVLKNK